MLDLLAIAAFFVFPYAVWRFFYKKKKRPASAPEWVPYYGHNDLSIGTDSVITLTTSRLTPPV